jgi:hypothetical protein
LDDDNADDDFNFGLDFEKFGPGSKKSSRANEDIDNFDFGNLGSN